VSDFKNHIRNAVGKTTCIKKTNNKLSKAVEVVEYRELKGEEGQF